MHAMMLSKTHGTKGVLSIGKKQADNENISKSNVDRG